MNDLLTSLCFALQGSGTTIYAIPLFIIAPSIIAGACMIVAGTKLQSTYQRGWLVITSGVLRVLFVFPFGVFALMLIVAGAIEIAAAIRLRKDVTGTVFLALAGIASILFLPLVLMAPRSLAPFPVLGALSIVFGACSLAFGLAMRSREAPAGRGVQPN